MYPITPKLCAGSAGEDQTGSSEDQSGSRSGNNGIERIERLRDSGSESPASRVNSKVQVQSEIIEEGRLAVECASLMRQHNQARVMYTGSEINEKRQ